MNRVTVGAGLILAMLMLVAALAPLLAPFSYETQDINRVLLTPNWINWFGTDALGRDLFSRVLYGARVSMTVGLVTSLVSMILGTIYGCISGYFSEALRGWLDSLMMRAVDVIQSFPHMVLMILISVLFASFTKIENGEAKSVLSIIVALSLVGWVNVARLVRNQVLQVKALPFVEAGAASGARHFRLIFFHILPNLLGPLAVMFTYLIPSQILLESFLSFIGLGLQPPFSSWGVLASEGWRSFRSHPHLILFPGTAIFVSMLACQFFGDGIRDLLDPHS